MNAVTAERKQGDSEAEPGPAENFESIPGTPEEASGREAAFLI